MKILTAEQLREVDRLSTAKFGIPSILLMENAGMRVVETLEERFENLADLEIAILCGRGNNGGDGFVVARQLLQKGMAPTVFLFAAEDGVHGDAKINLEILKAIGFPPTVIESEEDWNEEQLELADSDIVIDALLGTGVSKPVSGLYASVIDSLDNLTRATIVSVDLPSGLPADDSKPIGPAVHADMTITFSALKPSLVLAPANEHAGDVIVADIGNPDELLDAPEHVLNLLGPWFFQSAFGPRDSESNKGDFGKVLIVAGSRGKSGAAVMSGEAALRSGAGLVTVGTAASVQAFVASAMPELMTEALMETRDGTVAIQKLDPILKGKTILAIGPGLTTNAETSAFVRSTVLEATIPVVIDADGLNAFTHPSGDLRGDRVPIVITPHPGEMARLRGTDIAAITQDRIHVAQSFAKERNVYVVLKGYRTLIATPDGTVYVNPTGNPGMATGGTGDVLTGMIAGILAQDHLGSFVERLCLAVYLHGLAGDLAAEKIGEESMTATDLLRFLPEAWSELRD